MKTQQCQLPIQFDPNPLQAAHNTSHPENRLTNRELTNNLPVANLLPEYVRHSHHSVGVHFVVATTTSSACINNIVKLSPQHFDSSSHGSGFPFISFAEGTHTADEFIFVCCAKCVGIRLFMLAERRQHGLQPNAIISPAATILLPSGRIDLLASGWGGWFGRRACIGD